MPEMTVRSSTRGLPGLPRGRCGLSAFQASSDSQNKLFAMTIALQRLKSSANISSKSTSCMGSLPPEENRTQPIVMRFTGRESEMDRHAIGVHHRVNFARQAPSRATHILVIVVRDTGSVLVHAHDAASRPAASAPIIW